MHVTFLFHIIFVISLFTVTELQLVLFYPSFSEPSQFSFVASVCANIFLNIYIRAVISSLKTLLLSLVFVHALLLAFIYHRSYLRYHGVLRRLFIHSFLHHPFSIQCFMSSHPMHTFVPSCFFICAPSFITFSFFRAFSSVCVCVCVLLLLALFSSVIYASIN